jgi:hypothetical protein
MGVWKHETETVRVSMGVLLSKRPGIAEMEITRKWTLTACAYGNQILIIEY